MRRLTTSSLTDALKRKTQSFRRLVVFGLLITPILLTALPARAQLISQMVHTAWTSQNGAPQAITALAEGRDGILWIGSQSGLYSFDGTTFRAFQSPTGEPPLPSSAIDSVFVAKNGDLWVGIFQEGIAHVSDGHVRIYQSVDGAPIRRVESIQQAPDGTMWGISGSLIRFNEADNAWHKEATSTDQQRFLLIDSSGTQWLGARGGWYRRASDKEAFSAIPGMGGIPMAVAVARNGDVVLNRTIMPDDIGQTRRISQTGNAIEDYELKSEMWSMAFRPDGSLWMVDQAGKIVRVKPMQDELQAWPALPQPQDDFAVPNGLSGRPRAILTDRDGDVWVGTSEGIDRFRNATLVPFAPGRNAEWSICGDGQGPLWMAAQSSFLISVVGDRVTTYPSPGDIDNVTCGMHRPWFKDQANASTIEDGRVRSVPLPDKLKFYAATSVLETPEFGLTAVEGGSRGLWNFRPDIGWTKLALSQLDHVPIAYIVADPAGRIWMALKQAGGIGLFENDKYRDIPIAEPGIGFAKVFLESSKGLLVGGSSGLAILSNYRFEPFTFKDPESVRGLTGLVEADDGDIWLSNSRGVARIPRGEIELAKSNPAYKISSIPIIQKQFLGTNELDFQFSNSAAKDSSGRLWFATLDDIVYFDPRHPVPEPMSPILKINSVVADGHELVRQSSPSFRPQNLVISYSAVSLAVPENVVYRYQLEGFDDQWREVGHRTEAIYTGLPPGKYTFRVAASIGGDVWTPPAVWSSFSVPPKFYQTWWFAVLFILAAALIVWLIMEIRLRFLATEIRARADERADERVRIAQDLHDTLLQGVQGLMLSFHVAAQKISTNDASFPILERALSTADKILIEGRNRVNSLRADQFTDAELFESLKNVGADLNLTGDMVYRVERSGGPAELDAHIVDQVFIIAREALTNAFRHSGGTQIDIALDYGKRFFRLTCNDNGSGFDSSLPQIAPTLGHWGIKGMAERAKRIGGSFETGPGKDGSGTQVLVTIPARRAYRRGAFDFGF
jgi:two-component sensor histidine kinase/streptogramin lyase